MSEATASESRELTPLFGRVVVELDLPKQKSPGGIIIPEGSEDKSQWGQVVASAGDCDQLEDGDRVLVTPTQGTLYNFDDKEFVLIHEDSIKAKEA